MLTELRLVIESADVLEDVSSTYEREAESGKTDPCAGPSYSFEWQA